MFRDETWRRAAPDDASSWRESRKEDADRDERREQDKRRERRDDRRDDRRDRDRRDDREVRGPPRSQEEGKQNLPEKHEWCYTFCLQITNLSATVVKSYAKHLLNLNQQVALCAYITEGLG